MNFDLASWLTKGGNTDAMKDKDPAVTSKMVIRYLEIEAAVSLPFYFNLGCIWVAEMDWPSGVHAILEKNGRSL